MINYNSRAEIRDLLNDRGLAMSKRFGQNFLLSEPARQKIVNALGVGPDSSVWEIGPGIGAVTHHLAGAVKSLTVFEIDHGFASYIREVFDPLPGFTLVEGDFLKTWPKEAEGSLPDAVVGNLPYNVGSVMIGEIIQQGFLVPNMVFTLQKEVCQRMAAVPGTKAYSGFSLVCQLDYDVKLLGDIPSSSFYPVPDVTSAVVRMSLRQEPLTGYRRLYLDLVKDLFQARRKTLKNNLFKGELAKRFSREILLGALEKLEIDPSLRPERLTPENVAALADLLGETSV